MSTLAPSDLRIITKLVQILKQDHGIALEYQNPRLPQLICEKVFNLDDPVLIALWNTLSNQFKSASIPQKTPSANDAPDAEKATYYRGQKVKAKESAAVSAEVEDAPASEAPRKKGRFITYRGKKQWVEG